MNTRSEPSNTFSPLAGQFNYKPTKTGKLFHYDNSSIRVVLGPYGSGKTTMCITELMVQALHMPVARDGVRRFRALVLRNTYQQLSQTTIPSFINYLPSSKPFFKSTKEGSNSTIRYYGKDCDNVINDFEFIFIPFNSDEDLQKLLSFEITTVYMNELKTLPYKLLLHALQRTGRFPPMSSFDDKEAAKKRISQISGVIADTNSPAYEEHWIIEKLKYNEMLYDYQENISKDQIMDKTRPLCRYFEQPPAILEDDEGKYKINPLAENLENLPEGANYYLKNLSDRNHVEVNFMNKFSRDFPGMAVFPEFNEKLHVAPLDPKKGEPILLGWDFGATPHCLVSQYIDGQIRVLELLTRNVSIGVYEFCIAVVWKLLMQDSYSESEIISIIDPSAKNGDLNAASEFSQLKKAGMNPIKAYTNVINKRITDVRFFLNKLNLGHPGICLNNSKTLSLLRLGFKGGYAFDERVIKEDRPDYDLIPKKNAYSHPMDCLQYISGYIINKFVNVKEKKKEYTIINNTRIEL